MIRYALACSSGHRFDSWFADSTAFDDLSEKGLVECAVCGSREVGKTIMAPALVARSPAPAQAAMDRSAPAAPSAPPLADQAAQDLRAMAKAVRETVLAHTQDVGRRFADEVRRMHEGELPTRGVRGEATAHEARALLEDGILVLPLPPSPDDMN